MAMPDEQVRYDIEIQATEAIKALRDMIAKIDSADARVIAFSKRVAQMSKSWNVPFKDLLAKFKQLDTALASKGATPMFNAQGWQNVTKFIDSAADGGAKFAKNIDGAADKTEKFSRATRNASASTQTFAQRLLSVQNLIRTAFGTLLAVAIFNLLQLANTAFRAVIDNAKELELSLYRLLNVERQLSQQGIEISPKGLQEGIEAIKELVPIMSDLEITGLLGQVSLLTKEMGLSEQQIIDLAKAIVVLNINSTETEDVMSTASKVITALITGQARGVSALGLSFSDFAITTKAVEMGLLRAGEAASKLTDQQKAQVKFAIIMENTGQQLDTINEYLSTQDAATRDIKAAWTDLTTEMGKALSPLIVKGLTFIANALEGWVFVFERLQPLVTRFFSDLAASIALIEFMIQRIVSGEGFSLKELLVTFLQFSNDITAEALKEFGDNADTATEALEGINEVDTTAAQAEIDDLIEDLDRLDKKAAETEAAFQLKMERMAEDHFRDMRDMRTDYERDVQDVLRDFSNKRGDLERKYRDNELNAEAKFQEQLRQLREKFLFALEDALRERDARQVLRLIRQYQMDKQAAINEHNLERAERRQRFQEELRDLEEQKAERLRKLQEEYEIRRARAEEDYQIKKEREQADHERDMADLRQQVQDRLAEFAKAIGEEFGLREEGVNAVYEMLQKYYGPGGFIDGLYNYSANSMVANASAMLANLQSIIGQYQGMIASMSMMGFGSAFRPSSGLGGSTGLKSNIGKQAKGGTYLATAPTKAEFGEAGPELATFIPLNGLQSSNPISSIGSIGDRNDKIAVELLLSPDLEARIMENTLNEAADILFKVERKKS